MRNPFTHATLTPLAIHRILAVALVASLIIPVWYDSPTANFYTQLQGMVYDSLLPNGGGEPDPRVVVVDIDEQSLEAIGRWPWPRDTFATLLDRLQQSKPAVIGIDVLFPEPSNPASDVALTRQLTRPEVVTPITFGLPSGDDQPPPGAPERPWPEATIQVGLAPTLSAAALGHITPLYDPDHVIRRLYPTICLGDQCHPMLALRMLQSWSGQPVEYHPPRHRHPGTICVAGFCLGLNPDATLSIPYHHPSRFRHLSAADILDTEEANPALAGALVLIGTSSVGLGDRVPTPLSATTPGVEIHAILLASALDNLRWAQLPFAKPLLTALIATVLLLVLLWPESGIPFKVVTSGWLAALLLFSLLLPASGYWLDPLPLWGALLAAILLLATWQGTVLLRQRLQIYRAFASYVPHEVIKTLIRNNLRPEQLDAQRIDATVLFSDIRGFTALSERLEPEQLVDLTSHLFTAISEEVHRHKGTLDKYMGDAVMAFWGAPLPLADHAQLAMQCAGAIQRRLGDMGGWLSAHGYPEIRMTIGLESGPVAVGNFGSRQRRAYTVMGKTVNLAAHLQPMCTGLDVDILCGPELCRRLPDRVRAIGPVIIRGIEDEQWIGTPVTTPDRRRTRSTADG